MIVASDDSESRELQGTLGLDDGAAMVASPEDAVVFIESSRLGGLVMGSSCPSSLAKQLVRAYVQHQPCGRVAVLIASDVNTFASYLQLGSRVEVFLAPWQGTSLRHFLRLGAAAPALART